MAVDKVSTFSIFQSTINDVSRTQSLLADLQNQLSSGKKSPSFIGIADRSQQFFDLEAKLSKSTQYVTDNTVASNRLDATDTALTQVVNTATSLRNLILTRRSNTQGGNATFDVQVVQQWKALVSELNITLEGRYLFSGTSTDVAPVNASTFPTLQQSGIPDDGYYQGSTQNITIRADETTLMEYNVRADHEGFQKIFAGLVMARQGGQASSDQDLAKAYDLVDEGIDAIIALRANVNANKVTLTDINQNQRTLQLYWKGIQEDISSADLVAVSTQVAVNQGILQATFQAFATINSLRLSDFLR